MLYIAHPLAINLPCLHFKCGKIPSCTSLDTRSNNGLLRSASFFWLVKQSRRTWKEYWCKMLPQGELILLYLCVCVCVCVCGRQKQTWQVFLLHQAPCKPSQATAATWKTFSFFSSADGIQSTIWSDRSLIVGETFSEASCCVVLLIFVPFLI